MAEQIIEVHGAGFIPGLSGIYANCQIVVEDGKVLRVEPLGTPPPDTSAQPVEQSAEQDNQGG